MIAIWLEEATMRQSTGKGNMKKGKWEVKKRVCMGIYVLEKGHK